MTDGSWNSEAYIVASHLDWLTSAKCEPAFRSLLGYYCIESRIVRYGATRSCYRGSEDTNRRLRRGSDCEENCGYRSVSVDDHLRRIQCDDRHPNVRRANRTQWRDAECQVDCSCEAVEATEKKCPRRRRVSH